MVRSAGRVEIFVFSLTFMEYTFIESKYIESFPPSTLNLHKELLLSFSAYLIENCSPTLFIYFRIN